MPTILYEDIFLFVFLHHWRFKIW